MSTCGLVTLFSCFSHKSPNTDWVQIPSHVVFSLSKTFFFSPLQSNPLPSPLLPLLTSNKTLPFFLNNGRNYSFCIQSHSSIQEWRANSHGVLQVRRFAFGFIRETSRRLGEIPSTAGVRPNVHFFFSVVIAGGGKAVSFAPFFLSPPHLDHCEGGTGRSQACSL